MLAVILASGIFLGSVTSTALHATKKAKRIYQTIQSDTSVLKKKQKQKQKQQKKHFSILSQTSVKIYSLHKLRTILIYKSFASIIPFHQF